MDRAKRSEQRHRLKRLNPPLIQPRRRSIATPLSLSHCPSPSRPKKLQISIHLKNSPWTEASIDILIHDLSRRVQSPVTTFSVHKLEPRSKSYVYLRPRAKSVVHRASNGARLVPVAWAQEKRNDVNKVPLMLSATKQTKRPDAVHDSTKRRRTCQSLFFINSLLTCNPPLLEIFYTGCLTCPTCPTCLSSKSQPHSAPRTSSAPNCSPQTRWTLSISTLSTNALSRATSLAAHQHRASLSDSMRMNSSRVRPGRTSSQTWTLACTPIQPCHRVWEPALGWSRTPRLSRRKRHTSLTKNCCSWPMKRTSQLWQLLASGASERVSTRFQFSRYQTCTHYIAPNHPPFLSP